MGNLGLRVDSGNYYTNSQLLSRYGNFIPDAERWLRGYGEGQSPSSPALDQATLGSILLQDVNPPHTHTPIIGGWRKRPEKMMHNGFALQADGMESRGRRMLTGFSPHVQVT